MELLMGNMAFYLIIFGIAAVGLFLNIITSVWAYRDSIRKGRTHEYAIVVLIGTLFFPIAGFIVYLIIRNYE